MRPRVIPAEDFWMVAGTFRPDRFNEAAGYLRIPLKWIRDSDDLDHGFRRSGALVGAERRLVSQSPPSESYREIGTCPWRRR